MFNYTQLYKRVKTDVATESVTIDELKTYLRIEYNSEDELLRTLIKASRIYIENKTGLVLSQKTIQLLLSEIEDAEIMLKVSPVTTFVELTLKEGITDTVLTEGTDYDTQGSDKPIILMYATIAGTDKLLIECEAGYTKATLPEDLKDLWMQTAGHLFENRSTSDMGAIDLKIMPYIPIL